MLKNFANLLLVPRQPYFCQLTRYCADNILEIVSDNFKYDEALEKNLRIFYIALIIVPIFTALGGMCPKTALSNEEAALEKLKETAFNFREAAPGVYRSGLISKEAAPFLKEAGIKTVLSFDNNKKRAEAEKKRLEEIGINVISMPWSGWDDPNDEIISKTVEIIESQKNRPILVHCKHGQERTGVAIASWRIAHQGWSFEQAYQEMKACGFRSFQYGHLKKYIYEFARKHGDQNAMFGSELEKTKTNVLSFFYRSRKLNLFSK